MLPVPCPPLLLLSIVIVPDPLIFNIFGAFCFIAAVAPSALSYAPTTFIVGSVFSTFTLTRHVLSAWIGLSHIVGLAFIYSSSIFVFPALSFT